MIHFDNLQCYDSSYTLSIAEGIAAILTIASIHKHSYDESVWNIDDGEAVGAFSRSGNTITSSAPGSYLLCDTGGNTVLDVTMDEGFSIGTGNGLASDPYNYIGVRFTASYIEFLNNDGAVVARWPRPAGMAEARIVFSEVTTYKLEIDYKIIAVYQGDHVVAVHAVQSEDDASAAYLFISASGAGSFTIFMDDLNGIAKNASVDPGETPSSSMGRLMTGLAINMFARYDGAVRYYSSIPRIPDYTLDSYVREARSVKRVRAFRKLSGVVRAVSALPEAEYLHPDSVDKVGAQFMIAQNPNVISNAGARREAVRMQRKSREAFNTIAISGFVFPLMEPGDIFEAEGGAWIHDSSDMKLGAEGSFSGSTSGRSYEE